MELMNDLRTLLQHDVQLLYSCEKQIAHALPAMIEKANNPALKNALEQHLLITEQQLQTVDRIRHSIGADEDSVKDYSGFVANLLGSAECAGMKGLIEEGQKVMAENLSPEVMDAAIIGCCQKIEHYEIASYGTAATYARQLGLDDVATLLDNILTEEYEADRILTSLAISDVNLDAQTTGSTLHNGATTFV